MAIDTNKVRERRDRARQRRQTGADLYKFAEGETKVFLHGTSRPDDKHPEMSGGINWVECCFHRNLGGKNNLQLCLDIKNNPILTHPAVIEFAAKKQKNPLDLTRRYACPTCKRIENGEITGKLAARNAPQIQWLFGFTPMWFRRPKENDWSKLAFEPVIYVAGATIFDDTTDVIGKLGADPSDPMSATLFVVERVGTGFQSTEYKVAADIETIRNPHKLDKGQRRIIEEAMKIGGTCDLLRAVANFVKSPAQMEALMAGVDVAEEEEGGPSVPAGKECYGQEWEDCDECRECGESKACKAAMEGEPKGDAPEVREPDEEPGEEQGEEAGDAAEPPEDTGEGEEQGGDEEPPPSCFGTYEKQDAGCNECDLAKKCDAETNKGKEPARAPRRGKAGTEKKDEAPPSSDPSVDEMERQAAEVASRSRRRGRGK